MECPKCGTTETRIILTSISTVEPLTTRRRRCLRCGVEFETVEMYMKDYERLSYRNDCWEVIMADSKKKAAEMVRGRRK